MEYTPPQTHIDIREYEYIVSIGNKCPTTMILRELNLYKESFPFDYIPTTPALILKYLQNTKDFFPEKDVVRTKDGVWFGHYNISNEYETTITTFQRRFQRLFEILHQKKKILFVYTSEADVYNEMGNRYNDNYASLNAIVDYIQTTYKYTNFKILAVHTNKSYENTENILNYTIHVPSQYLSDTMSTHVPEVWNTYRDILKELLKTIFQV
jgi:hypothetical protein